MLEFLQRLFLGHVHKYETKETYEETSGRTGKAINIVYVQECKICGKMNSFKVR